jgi:hypothetical protein
MPVLFSGLCQDEPMGSQRESSIIDRVVDNLQRRIALAPLA